MAFELTWSWLLIILGLIALAVFQLGSVGKPKTRKAVTWISFILLGFSILAMSGVISQLSSLNNPIQFGAEQLAVTPTSGGLIVGGKCANVEDITVTLSAIDAETALSTGGTHRYMIGNGAAKELSDAGTFTASPGDTLKILFGNASTGSSLYFSEVQEHILPCLGTVEYTAKLYKNGTINVEVFNEEGNLIDTTSENETLAAGDVVTLNMNIKGTYQRGIPYGGVMVIEYNSSEIDDVRPTIAGASPTSVPTFHTVSATVNAVKAYTYAPLISNQIYSGTILIDADDTNNPTSNGGDIHIYFYTNNPYINEDNSGSFEAPAIEDEDGAKTYNHKKDYTLSID